MSYKLSVLGLAAILSLAFIFFVFPAAAQTYNWECYDDNAENTTGFVYATQEQCQKECADPHTKAGGKYSCRQIQTPVNQPPPGGGGGATGGTGGGGGATGTTQQTISIKNPLGAENMTIAELLDKVANFLLIISVPIAAIMVVIGGYQIMVFSSNPEKVKIGKNTILYAAIGFAIVLLAKGVTVVIKEVLGAKGGAGSPPAATSPPTAGQGGGEKSERPEGGLIPE